MTPGVTQAGGSFAQDGTPSYAQDGSPFSAPPLPASLFFADVGTDAGKGIEVAVNVVYPGVEHRECMRHLWNNVKKKKLCGPLFSQNMWVAAKAFTHEKYNYHMSKIEEKCSAAMEWLDENHPCVWTRSKFWEDCKVDYINNNLSESFNNWVSKTKIFQIVDMHDRIRQMIISKFDLRHKIGKDMKRRIIPSIIAALDEQSKVIKDHEVLKFGDVTTEVTISTIWHSVNLEQMTCSCRSWQVIEKPCSHALGFIVTQTRDIDLDDYVHEYMEMFRKTYVGVFKPMTSKQLWPRVDIGYTIKKPKLRRKPGRPRVSRIKASEEPGNKKKRECTECHELGHTTKY
jgi:hypothetical protein